MKSLRAVVTLIAICALALLLTATAGAVVSGSQAKRMMTGQTFTVPQNRMTPTGGLTDTWIMRITKGTPARGYVVLKLKSGGTGTFKDASPTGSWLGSRTTVPITWSATGGNLPKAGGSATGKLTLRGTNQNTNWDVNYTLIFSSRRGTFTLVLHFGPGNDVYSGFRPIKVK